MKIKLTGVIEREDDLYVALCPEVDVVSQGHTIDEARKNLIEALELFFECASESEIKRRLRKGHYIPPVAEMQSRLAEEYEIQYHPLSEMYVTPIEVVHG